MNARKKSLISTLAALAILTVGCGGGGSSPNPPAQIAVSFSPQPPTSMVVGQSTSLTAVVTNDSAAAGVTWKVTCSSSDCGSFNPSSTPGNSGTTSYTAPATVPTNNTVLITATSVTDSTKSAAATITITATPTISVVISNPPSSLVVSTTSNLSAVVSEDTAAAGVTWTVTCGSAQCGSFSASTTPGNSPTTIYTAPAAVPTGNTVTVKATSVTDNTKSATATITITTAPPAVLADGNYVFHVGGQDTNGPYFVAGVFTVQNSVITAGEQDYIDYNGGGQNTLVATNSSLTLETGGNIQIILNTGSGPGVGGLETFRASMVSATRGYLSEFDTFAAGTGTLELQTSAAAPSGSYAFSLGGVDGSSNEYPLVIGGVLNINGTALVTSGSIFDYSDGGNVGQGQTFSSGTVSAPDSFGRVTINLTPSNATAFGLIGYVVGQNRIQFVESSTDQLQATLGGSALGQAKTNSFAAADVSGQSYAFIANGADGNGIANFGGVFTFNSDGTLGGVVAYNDGVFHQGPQITSGGWTIDPTGRVTLSNVMLNNAGIGNGPYTFQLYVDGNGNALELGIDDIQGSMGPAYLQNGNLTAGSYTISAQGFVSDDSGDAFVWGGVGPVTIDSSNNWSGFTDFNVFTGTPVANMNLSGTTETGGLFQLTGLSAVTNPTGPNTFGYWPVNSTKVLALELDDQQIGIFVIETNNQ
ncbi:MAG TPA: hypothetical protein VMT75_04810 [Candidatus Saccharimonadales bacterium]|nr:hypothetical protein [Candidatus Saccharimonadales bacterium]